MATTKTATTKTIITIFLLATLTIAMASSSEDTQNLISQDEIPKPFRGINYFPRPYKPRQIATCDLFPRVCRAKGSPGPDCCKKQCVNVMTDNLNCGECGRTCRYGETCCGGNCVDVMFNEKNCGACKNKCKKGSFCYFGMCSYA